MLRGVGAACGFIEGSEEAWKRAGVPSVMLCDTHSLAHMTGTLSCPGREVSVNQGFEGHTVGTPCCRGHRRAPELHVPTWRPDAGAAGVGLVPGHQRDGRDKLLLELSVMVAVVPRTVRVLVANTCGQT